MLPRGELHLAEICGDMLCVHAQHRFPATFIEFSRRSSAAKQGSSIAVFELRPRYDVGYCYEIICSCLPQSAGIPGGGKHPGDAANLKRLLRVLDAVGDGRWSEREIML